METKNRQVILASSDETIDKLIRLLTAGCVFHDDIKSIVRQLKAEQKRLFYSDQESSVRLIP